MVRSRAVRAISLPFSFDSNGGIAGTTNEKKIIQDRLLLAVMTKPGERVMRPSYGSQVHLSLFETFDGAASTARQAITACFAEWFPYLVLDRVDVAVDPQEGGLILDIKYKKSAQDLVEGIQIRTGSFTRAGEPTEEQ